MRVLISVDMEGAAGVVDGEDVQPGQGAYEHNRGLLTAEANATLAAHRGVPAVLVSGDDSVAAEAAQVAPRMHTVVVKRALGARAAALLHPEEARERIEQAVPRALADREAIAGAMGALRFDGPVLLEVEVLMPHMTERALLMPGVERAGGCTLRYRAPDFPTAYQVTQLITMLGGI
jgi:D-amino peptidase